MVGMGHVAEQFDSLLDETIVNQRRREAGLPVETSSNHLVFTGSPGTGKTTVARELGKAYHALGIIPSDKFVEVKNPRSAMVAEYVGQTAPKTRKVFEQARGGVLFIDEAYTLAKDDYGKEALTQLMTDMENHRDDTVVILAGYPKEMAALTKANPGLRSRLPRTIEFPDYNAEQMRQILHGMFRQGQYTGAPGTSEAIKAATEALQSSREHGNARGVRNLYEETKRAQARRIAGDPEAPLHRIAPEDVQAALTKLQASKRVGKGRLRPKDDEAL